MEKSEFYTKRKYSEASGSMAVVESNIKMKMNELGLFEEKLIDENKEVSEIAKSVSPNMNTDLNETIIANQLYGEIEGISFDKRIGYYQSLYAGHVTEGNYRENASSGGMGTWIFKELFDKDLIDYVIHVKKNNESNNENNMFKYDISTTIEEIKAGAKTRYYPVEISEVMEIVKERKGRYAIIGIPSFIYSIRLLAEADEVIKDRIKYTIGLVCGHQKSTKFAESMAWQVGIQPGNLKDIDFRHKLADRPANNYAVKMTGLINGKTETIIKPTSELFGQNWGWGFFKPTASNFTDDVFNETADIVLGDAWLSKYTKDSQGSNIVIVRNSKINQLIKVAINEGRLQMDVVNNDTIFATQSSHYRHTHDELAYRLYIKEQENECYPKKRVTPSNDISDTRRKIQDLRRIISEQSHIHYQEALEKEDFRYFEQAMSQYIHDYTELYKNISKQSKILKILKMGPKKIIRKIIYRLRK